VAQRRVRIGARVDVAERGTIKFSFSQGGEDREGFVVRYKGRLYAYMNVCAHVPLKLDQETGQFVSPGGATLRCLNHGAIYDPVTGRGIAGPAKGRFLRWLSVSEEGDDIWLVVREGDDTTPADPPRCEQAGQDPQRG
jgi:nitrite reductase/ring-hydroxylating ferredoxin subunit